jgi:mannitol-specific phosphotransferase system IIBC component
MRDFLKEVSAVKKSLIFILCGIVVLFLTARVLIAQDPKQTQQTQAKQEQKTAKVSEEFLNTWKKVGDKTKEIRSFKTEKAITVAGVRGAEAEDEALKYLYFKGG